MKPHRLTYTIPNARRDLLSGRKRQTMRLAERWGHVVAGDPLEHLVWVGKPRQKGSRLDHVLSATCSETMEYIVRLEAEVGRAFARTGSAGELVMLSQDAHTRLADRDGFGSWPELVEALRGFYGETPVEMVAIRWPRPGAEACPPERQRRRGE